jgi:dTDP-glucose 4,6-dehydratase
MRSIKEGKKIPVYGDGKQVREWMDVTDNTLVIYNLMMSEQINEVFNIGSEERYTNLEVIEMIGNIMGRTPEFEFVADRLGHDRRYALNSSKVNSILGEMIPLSFEEFLKEETIKLLETQL